MYVGTAYYPEHWPVERWTTDFQLMKDAGFSAYESGAVGMSASSTREYQVTSQELDGQYMATKYFDWVRPTTANSIAGHAKESHLKEYAAVTQNKYGAGAAWYVGTIFKEQQFYEALLRRIADEAGVVTTLSPPRGVAAVERVGPRSRLLFLINHTDAPQEIDSIPQNSGDLLTGEEVQFTENSA